MTEILNWTRFVIIFFSKEQAYFNFMATLTASSDFGCQETKIYHCFHFPPFICSGVMGPAVMIFIFWILSFKPIFSLSSFTLFKRLFNYSSLSPIRVASSAYLRLLVFLLAILIPAYDSSSLAFHMTYSAFKLNKQGESIWLWYTTFPIWIQSIFPCLVLTIAFWPT